MAGSEPRPAMSSPVREPKKRPDPRPMRLAFGMTGLAALSTMIAAIVSPAPPISPDPSAAVPTTAADVPTTISVPVRHVTRYVTLKPGETAPPGAKVVTKPALAPQVIVTQITVAAPARAPQPVVVVRTKQSGG
jgi:hypothetical protein